MKKIYLLLFSLMGGVMLKAQSLTCTFSCSTNLLNAQFTVDSMKNISYGKTSPLNYVDVIYKKNIDNDCDLVSATTCISTIDALFYHVYYPKNYSGYLTCPLPAIVIFHGGAYLDCNGIDDAPNIKLICRTLAARGYVVFNCEYRRGTLDEPLSQPYYSAQRTLAFLRAFQDGRGAIRSIIQYQREHHAATEKFQIDTNNIFVAGASAGCAIAIHLAYYPTQQQANEVFKNALDYAGTINQDFYKGDTTIDYFSKIKGLFLMWGNGFLPTQYMNNPTAFFSGNSHLVPIIAFHGRGDKVAPIGTKPVNFSPPSHTKYNSESHCLPFHSGAYTPDASVTPNMFSFGSETFYDYLKTLVAIEFYEDCTAGHGLQLNTDPNGYYGTGYGDSQTDLVSEYLAIRAAIFFQAVGTGKAFINSSGNYSLGQSHFIDCENTRYGCTAATMSCSNNTCN